MDFMDGVEGSKKGYGLMDEVVWMSTISGHGIWMEMFDKKAYNGIWYGISWWRSLRTFSCGKVLL